MSLGESALEDVIDPFDGNVLVEANGMIDEQYCNAIENSGIANCENKV